MRLSGATESAVNHSKQMKRGVYEQGRKISKPLQLRRPYITVQHLRATQTDSCNSKVGGLESRTSVGEHRIGRYLSSISPLL
jgi:hypothetical protein